VNKRNRAKCGSKVENKVFAGLLPAPFTANPRTCSPAGLFLSKDDSGQLPPQGIFHSFGSAFTASDAADV